MGIVDGWLWGAGDGRGGRARGGSPELEKMAAGELTGAGEDGGGGGRGRGRRTLAPAAGWWPAAGVNSVFFLVLATKIIYFLK